MEILNKSFRKLRWQLTLSFTIVTLGTLLVAILVLAPILLKQIFLPNNILSPLDWYRIAAEDGPLVIELLEQEPVDLDLVRVILSGQTATITSRELFKVGAFELGVRTIASLNTIILGPEGELLGVHDMTGLPGARFGYPLDPNLVPGLREPLENAMNGSEDPSQLITVISPDEEFILVFPVTSYTAGERNYLGTVILHIQRLPTSSDIPVHVLGLAGRGLLLFILGAGLIGALFGGITANRLTTRFERISTTAESWSEGDLSQFIGDSTEDEIGQLSSNLDGMAVQLQETLKQQQEIAVVEERNRLARELHDSTKQQALAASFQLGAAINLIDEDPKAAKERLLEADAMVDSVRLELTDLIHELRPVSMEGRDLAEALEAYAIEWAHQNDVKLELGIAPDNALNLDHRQTLYRVAQEALANIARHSGAENVRLSLEYIPDYIHHPEDVKLCLQDDGCGFDPTGEYPGMGLESMQERCAALGGTLQIDSSLGVGTRLCAKLKIIGTEDAAD